MKGAAKKQFDRAIGAAASLSGKRFGLLVASSLVATTGIVAAGLTSTADSSPLAALLGRSLASSQTPIAAEPAPEPEPAGEGGGSSAASSGPAPVSSAPLESVAPEAAPEEAAPEPEPEETTPTVPAAATPEAGQVKHVFVVSVTSPGYEAAFGATPQMPYLASLRPQGQLLSGYKLLGSAGLPNRIAAISGQPPNEATKADCSTYSEFTTTKLNAKGVVSGSGCIHPVDALTLADQLVGARFTWRGYFEGMIDETGKPDTCVQPEVEALDQPLPGAYAAARNPFVYFHSLLDLGDCTENDLPLSELETDLRKIESTPSFSYVSPTPCNAGRPGQCVPGTTEGVAAADAFLAAWVPKILASPAYKKDGLLIVSFDEASPEAKATDPVGALLLSKFVSPGATDANEYNPYSLLKSTEELFGLPYLANAGSVKVRSFGQGLRGGEAGTGD
jgi:hypothetical protein